MSDILDELASDFSDLSVELDSPVFTWSGVDYVCVPSTENRGLEVQVGGNMVPVTLSLHCLASLFSTTPRAGQVVTFRGNTYTIVSVSDAQQTLLRLDLVDYNT